MNCYLIERAETYTRYSELIGWRATLDEAQRWCLQNAPTDEYAYLNIYELAPNGDIECVESHQHRPEIYRGPLVRARINREGFGTSFHRVPIDCWIPRHVARDLYEDQPFRVVATSTMPDGYDSTVYDASWLACLCGEWQEIEGAPDTVAELVARFPVDRTSGTQS